MKKNFRIGLNVTYIIIGCILIAMKGEGENALFLCSFGTGLIVGGVLLLIKNIRYRVDKPYQEHVDVEVTDERNKYIRMKAWSWAGYLYVMLLVVTMIICLIIGLFEYAQLVSYAMCTLLCIYVVAYFVLRKKY